MGVEIERKFVLPAFPEELIKTGELKIVSQVKIDQTYLAYAKEQEFRIRRLENLLQPGQVSYTHTYKKGSGLAREEIEVELLPEVYDQLAAASHKKPLQKTRTTVQWEQFIFEIDSYHQYDMITIEIEFHSVEDAKAFQPPSWFGREVGGEEEFRNKKLWADLQ